MRTVIVGFDTDKNCMSLSVSHDPARYPRIGLDFSHRASFGVGFRSIPLRSFVSFGVRRYWMR